ncbi:hypothetical protein BDV32DRAFT_154518 [Aspergillus pseudonomiae]|uniref:Uncharacterized protein n=1 Tax=Aspergillus pseudonomiae TaxID=1506151 RepID=A0A5N7CX66_9EURO|nr:uncharacterized protein BDV37DRAFT_288392 [Aspergillus pseudonomiae]KAB8255151.1 hypothetical protein BDV32DRAFT_154518 [Aspergillus pseudonomiae]KAE8398549.1 hypothetical protein BDV37DRAFT_288392 [Aspergillus pseudonomiae]
MQIVSAIPTLTALMSGVQAADMIMRWHGCGDKYQKTETSGDGCTNVSGFKTENLCSVEVPPPGTERCELYTADRGNPFGSTYYCNAGQRCDTASWDVIDSYSCYT